MSNANSWHVEKVRFKSGWREIGNIADIEMRWNNQVVLFSIKYVTQTDFLESGIQIKGNESHLELAVALQTMPETIIKKWLIQRLELMQKLRANVEQKNWNRGVPTPPSSYASLAHLYEILVAENVKDVVTELQLIMNTPTREGAAMRIKTARSKNYLTKPSRGVTQGNATALSQETLPCNWVSTYYR